MSCSIFSTTMICIFCVLLLYSTVLVESAHNRRDIINMGEILATEDFAEAVVKLAKIWTNMHAQKSVDLSDSKLTELRERLSLLQSRKDGTVVGVLEKNEENSYEEKNSQDNNKKRNNLDTGTKRRSKRHVRKTRSAGDELLDRVQNRTIVHADDLDRHHRRVISEHDQFEEPLDTSLPGGRQPAFLERSGADGNANRGTCPHCVPDAEAKRIRLQAIKQQILTKLRLASPPNVTKFANNPRIPAIARLMNQEQRQNDDPGVTYAIEGDEEFYAKPSRVIQIAESLPTQITQITNSTDNLCYFTFQEQVFRHRIQSAKLSLFIRPLRTQQRGRRMSTVILVHTVGLSTHNGRTLNTTLVQTLDLDLRHSGRWHSFDVKTEVVHMAKFSSFGVFKVEAYDHDGRPMAITRPLNEQEEQLVPYLDIRLKERPHRRRQKRHFSRDCDATSQEERCCRYPFIVDFEEFGWDFVQQPRRFNAFYCSGTCDINHNQHVNPYGHLVEQVRNNPYASSGPCCVASKLASRSMLYRDDNGTFIYGIIPGMSVLKCGCA